MFNWEGGGILVQDLVLDVQSGALLALVRHSAINRVCKERHLAHYATPHPSKRPHPTLPDPQCHRPPATQDPLKHTGGSAG